MKTILFSCALLFSTMLFSQTNKPPFYGTKNFSFTFGNCCEHSITISKNGNCIIKGGISVNNKILYNGKYLDTMWIYDKSKKKIGGFRIDGNAITSLNKKGNIEKECGMNADEFCVTEFY